MTEVWAPAIVTRLSASKGSGFLGLKFDPPLVCRNTRFWPFETKPPWRDTVVGDRVLVRVEHDSF